MLPILLMILKLIGIVILALLGLVLAVLLLVLFVPVRYGISGSYFGKAQGTVKVTWLLHALSLKVTYEDGLDVVVRVLGKRVLWRKEGAEDVKGELEEDARKTGELIEDGLSVDFVEGAEDEDGPEAEMGETAGDDDFETGGTEEDDPDSAGPGLKEKLKNLQRSVKDTWTRLEGYRERAVSFWNDERNRKTVKVVLRQIKAIIRHILPGKIQGKAVFGFEDPSTTGKVLSALSVVYAWYGDKFEIVPVFDRSILEVEGSLKGRVQAGAIVARGVRVLLNKNFRRLVWSLIRNGGK